MANYKATVTGIKVNEPTVYWTLQPESPNKEILKAKVRRIVKIMKEKGFTVQVKWDN